MGVVLVWFAINLTFPETRKRNKLRHFRKSKSVEGAHCRELIVAGERVLTGGVFVLTFYEGCYLAAFTFPCFLRYRVTSIWLSIWYSSSIGSVVRYSPCEH